MAKFTLALSGESFRFNANAILRYCQTLDSKCEQFVKEVAEAGYKVINAVLSEHVRTAQTIGSLRIETSGEDGFIKASVVVESDAIMFLEFGSGINHQAISAPHAGDYDTPYGPGTFPSTVGRQNPDYDNWANPEGWYYYDEAGNRHWSDGMYPSYPMYQGGKEMENRLQEIAMRIFSDA